LLQVPAKGRPPGAPPPFVWAGLKPTETPLIAAAKEAAKDEAGQEYRRLLYVGMTRAIDRLVVCGFEGLQKKPENCWYQLVFDAMQPLSIEEAADDNEGTVWRYRKVTGSGAAKSDTDQSAAESAETLPAWLSRDVGPEPPSPVALSPSRALEAAAPLRGAGAMNIDRRKAMQRGTLVHRLLQALPDIPPAQRDEAIRGYLARAARDFTDGEQEQIAAQVTAVLDDSRFAALFAPGSRAEVPIVGRLVRDGRTFTISGVVDRMVVTGDAVLIADYKTNDPAPRRPEDVPNYVTQLALYRAVLAKLYPAHDIRAALVWTHAPGLMALSPQALDEALARFTPA
jgi:ATP-dependent helicase/nuclease subunit A